LQPLKIFINNNRFENNFVSSPYSPTLSKMASSAEPKTVEIMK
jgi:hypothetical protein